MGVLPSTGAAGDGFRSAIAESLFATLECELIDRRARGPIFGLIGDGYHPRRRDLEKFSLLTASAHLRAGGDSLNVSTKPG